MAEYITKKAAINAVENAPIELFQSEWEEIEEAINTAPAADVVPVVRCKDCKWFVDNNGGEWYGCKMFQVVRITPEDAPKPDDFCSYGERKDGGADNS